jgi:hypothetical protein
MSFPIYCRQRKETSKAFEAFQLYRDLGPERSLAKVGQQLGKSTTLMERWSQKWNWVVRAAAWDEVQDRRIQEAQLKAIAEMKERHAKMGGILQTKALEGLANLVPSQLKPNTLLSFLIQGVKMECEGRGQPSQITEQQSNTDREDLEYLWDALKQDEIRKTLAGLSRRAGMPTSLVPKTEPSANGHVAESNGDMPHP